MLKKIWQTLAITGIALVSLSVQAQSQTQTQTQNHPRPPREAVEACYKKAEGDACSFMGRNNETVSGTCKKGPRGERSACVPAHMHDEGGKMEMPAGQ